MINKLDRYIIFRLFTITLFVIAVLVFIFIMIDFSENSDDYTDKGAKMAEIWGSYYLNYIPEMIRLILPVAVFTACLFLTGQLSERLEITALKAAGISLYRLIVPYLIFAFLSAGTISFLDSRVIPNSNEAKTAFEEKYLKKKSEKIDSNHIYRQLSKSTILSVNYYEPNQNIAYRIQLTDSDSTGVKKTLRADQMAWDSENEIWNLKSITIREFSKNGYIESSITKIDTTLNIYPRDLSRSTSDIYQLTYSEAIDYISSIERSGAGNVNLPKVQFYGRLVYPLSIIIVIIIGFAVASVRRRGGKGLYLAAGLAISFLYLAFMKIAEPFGYHGAIDPVLAASMAHISFFIVGLFLLISAKK
jgi:lipopolysaccharide export system permease protein